MPQLSVILPIYNAESYLRQSLDSLLVQSFTDFEVIAVNDGSKDGSLAILQDYAQRDNRIHIIDQSNLGLVKTLNKAIALAEGTYIARMDADDICLPHRFAMQMDIFERYPGTVLVGGSFEVINEFDEHIETVPLPTKDEDIKRAMLYYNPIAHGSAVFTRAAFDAVGGYSDGVGPTEDYDLWCKLAALGKFRAVGHSIFRWRVNPTGITSTQNADMLEATMRHKDFMWGFLKPGIVSRGKMKQRGRFYVHQYGSLGSEMRKVMLDNNSYIAIKMLRKGQLIKGAWQLIAVALVGKTGFHVVLDRANNTLKHGLKMLLRRG